MWGSGVCRSEHGLDTSNEEEGGMLVCVCVCTLKYDLQSAKKRGLSAMAAAKHMEKGESQ